MLYILAYGQAGYGGTDWIDYAYTLSKSVAEKWVAKAPMTRKYREVKMYNGEGL